LPDDDTVSSDDGDNGTEVDPGPDEEDELGNLCEIVMQAEEAEGGSEDEDQKVDEKESLVFKSREGATEAVLSTNILACK
jgi:hypothetical protein